MGPKTKTCQNCKKEFVIEPEDFKFYEKIKVPPPTCLLVGRPGARSAATCFFGGGVYN